MFDEDDYYSDQQQINYLQRPATAPKKSQPPTQHNFNIADDNQSYLKIMKQRGFDLTVTQVQNKKNKQQKSLIKQKQPSKSKQKSKTGFFDSFNKASLQQLQKALTKAFNNADPQQANCILSYILEKKLEQDIRNKYSIMKCNLLFGLGEYRDCVNKCLQILKTQPNKLLSAILCNLMAKSRQQLNEILKGYYDLLRSKSLIKQYKQSSHNIPQQLENFAETELDTTIRQINHTQLEYNIKMSEYKNNTNLVYPYYQQFRHRMIKQISCGDYHALFLTGNSLNNQISCEVFGIGENTVGQVTGRQQAMIYNQPVLIADFSNKQIAGIFASKQSSLAYDNKGDIYQWGFKQHRNNEINLTFSLNQPIKMLQKGYKHYACLTFSNNFYTWGTIEHQGVAIWNKPKPHLHNVQILSFSCGNNHTISISKGKAYSIGDNKYGQLGNLQQKFYKDFKLIKKIHNIKQVFCIGDCTFFITEQQTLYCGKISYNKQPQYQARQVEFPCQLPNIINISGYIGQYNVADCIGNLYYWDVDSSVKFKLDKENLTQRYSKNCRGLMLRVKNIINGQHSKLTRKTKQLKTYQNITYNLDLYDQYGPYGNQLILPLKCQIYLSTSKQSNQKIMEQNTIFISSIKQTKPSLLLNQIIEQKLLNYEVICNKQQSWRYEINLQIEKSGKYYFYFIINDNLICQQAIDVQVSQKQAQLQQKNKAERSIKQEQKKKKAELQRNRLLQQKLNKQQWQEQKRKQTQRRAQQVLKNHLLQQQSAQKALQQEKVRRKQLQVGGGYDINKLKKKPSGEFVKKMSTEKRLSQQRVQKIGMSSISSLSGTEGFSTMQKTTESFLPVINVRPNSKKKLGLPKPSELITLSKEPARETLKQSLKDTLKQSSNDVQIPVTRTTIINKNQKLKSTKLSESFGSVGNHKIESARPIIKRGLSKGKK